jgi:hypothetical protein
VAGWEGSALFAVLLDLPVFLNPRRAIPSLLRLPHRLPQRSECRFGFSNQNVSLSSQLAATLHESLRRLSHDLCPTPYFCGEHFTGIKMRADACIAVTPRTRTHTRPDKVGGQLSFQCLSASS